MSDDENDVPEETFLGLQQDEDDFLSQVLKNGKTLGGAGERNVFWP